jgi:hypothetical protein
MIGFQREINLVFSLFIDGDNNVFSPLCSDNDLFKKRNLNNDNSF